MANALLITGRTEEVGKTPIALSLALKFKEEGLNVGYFKPIGWKIKTKDIMDRDVKIAKSILKMEEDESLISPILADRLYWSAEFVKGDVIEEEKSLMGRIADAYEELSKNYDFLVIEGCRTMAFFEFIGLSAPQLSVALKAPILLVNNDRLTTVDELIQDARYCAGVHGAQVLGAIINNVIRETIERAKEFMIPLLEANNVHVYGILPEKLELKALIVKEILEDLEGEVLAGEENLNNIIENILIGAMGPEAALKHFRRAVRKAVVTGGDRADMVVSALETDTSCLILTGNLFPPAQVLSLADEKNIPVILVPYDTYTTVEKLNKSKMHGHLRPEKIETWKKLIEENINWKEILEATKKSKR